MIVGIARDAGVRVFWLAIGVGVALSFCAPGAFAQNVNCNTPSTQYELNVCAGWDLEAADAQLNAVWQQVKPQMDQAGLGGQLLDAQRKWLAFRDAACAVERAQVAGGSIAPFVQLDCLARLTKARTQDLIGLRY